MGVWKGTAGAKRPWRWGGWHVRERREERLEQMEENGGRMRLEGTRSRPCRVLGLLWEFLRVMSKGETGSSHTHSLWPRAPHPFADI